MRNFLIFLILVIFVSGACERFIHKDYSLTVKEYQKLGMPDPDKSWSIRNYFDAHVTLGTLKIYNPKSLPRKHSKKSGAIFNRMVNKEILSAFDEPGIPLTSKAMEIQQFARLPSDMISLYSDKLKSEQYYNEELADIYIFALRVQDKKMELAGKIMNSKDEADISFQYGLKSVVNNYLSMIKIILEVQLKSKVYHKKDLERLSMEVSRSLTQNQEFILGTDKETLTSQIQSVIEKSPSGNIKENYIKTLKVLND
jgi:hypothetical protein